MSGFLRIGSLSGLFLASMVCLAPAFAADNQADCGEVDLRAEFQARTNAPSVRNQSNADWCYAFAAADLLSWHTGRAGAPRYYSALDLADSYFERYYPNQSVMSLRDTPGSLQFAISTGEARGACAETTLPDSSFDLMRKQCDAAGRDTPRDVQVLGYDKSSSFQKIQGIDKELNRGNLAVMQYRVNFMANPECDRNHKPAWAGMHDVPVMARRWNSNLNQCEYLLRSSWGSGPEFGYGVTCRDITILSEGYFWISYRDILGSVDQVFFIDP